MEQKRILILGAGRGHLGLMKASKEMGLYSIVVGLPGDYPCIPLADKFCIADISKPDEVLAIAESEHADGAIICASDTGLMSLGLVCDRLGLCGISYRSATLSHNKCLMKKALTDHGVRTAKFITVSSYSEFLSKSTQLSYPLMVKAVDLQGSRGIYKVSSQDEAQNALRNVFELSSCSYCVVEEFIDGNEFGAQAFVTNGSVRFVLPHGDEVYDTGHTKVPVGHYMPIRGFDSDLKRDIEDQVIKAINALGLNNCAVNADLIERNGEIFLIELSGRSGANCLAELTSIYLGIDYYKLMLLNALGEKTDYMLRGINTDNGKACMSKMLYSSAEGTVTKITYTQVENAEVDFFVKPSDEVRLISSSNDAIGQIIVRSNNLDECYKIIGQAESKICLDVRH